MVSYRRASTPSIEDNLNTCAIPQRGSAVATAPRRFANLLFREEIGYSRVLGGVYQRERDSEAEAAG